MATGRSAFLINTARPDLAVSNIFQVAEGGVRITASGLRDTDYVELQKQTSPQAGSFAAVWTPVVRQGQSVRLSKNNIEHVELITGIYRVEFNGADNSDLVVYMSEDQALLDSKLIYNYPAYNPAFNGEVTGTNLSPGLVSSRDRPGHWAYDTTLRQYVWVESIIDTSTGAVVYEFFTQPGGSPITPEKLIQQPRSYPSCEQLLFFDVVGSGTGVGEDPIIGGFALSQVWNIDQNLVPKKITIIVDSGSFTMTDIANGSIVIAADETYSFAVTSEMGQLEHYLPNLEYLTLSPVTGTGDNARVIVQCCHVSPKCYVDAIGGD